MYACSRLTLFTILAAVLLAEPQLADGMPVYKRKATSQPIHDFDDPKHDVPRNIQNGYIEKLWSNNPFLFNEKLVPLTPWMDIRKRFPYEILEPTSDSTGSDMSSGSDTDSGDSRSIRKVRRLSRSGGSIPDLNIV